MSYKFISSRNWLRANKIDRNGACISMNQNALDLLRYLYAIADFLKFQLLYGSDSSHPLPPYPTSRGSLSMNLQHFTKLSYAEIAKYPRTK